MPSIQRTDLYEKSDDELEELYQQLGRDGRWQEQKTVWDERDVRRQEAEAEDRQRQHEAEIAMMRGEPPKRRAGERYGPKDADALESMPLKERVAAAKRMLLGEPLQQETSE